MDDFIFKGLKIFVVEIIDLLLDISKLLYMHLIVDSDHSLRHNIAWFGWILNLLTSFV